MESLLVPTQAESTIPGKRILVLAPHPDDEVFGCGGAIMRHLAQGASVRVRIWTSGGYGVGADDKAAYVATRQRESIAAAKVLGYGTPEFGNSEDRSLQYSEKLVQDVLAAIAAMDADLVYAPSVMEMHPDHRALAMATVEAVRRRGADVRLAQYEVGIPLRPNLLLDITDLAERKLQAMQCFTSQLGRQRYDLDVAALNRFRSYTLPAAVTAAEAYTIVTGAGLQHDPLGLYQSEHARQHALGLPLDSADYPLVSVIVRSMDRPSLSVALDSIALQTYPNIEVVLVNATGSAHADPGAWCGRFPLRMIEPGRALERSAACNCGLDAARGELLIFLDDDDLFLPHHVYRLHEELERNPHAIAAYAGVICTDVSGKELRHFAEPFDALKLAIGNFIPIHSLLFRRAGVQNGARFDESLPVCEDWDFWLQLQLQGVFRFVPETGAVYRMQTELGSGVWVDQERNRRVILQIYRKRLAGWTDNVLWGIFEWTRYKPLYEDLTAAHRQLEQEFRDRVASEALLQQERAGQASRIEEMQGVLAQREARIDELHTMQKQTVLALHERDDRIAMLLASTSWRITRPMRVIVRLFKRVLAALSARPAPSAALPVRQQDEQTRQQQESPAPQQEISVAASGPTNHYDYEVDLKTQSAAGFVLELTGAGKRVLEIGCGPGSITKLLHRIGHCHVTAIELDAAAIERARPWCAAIHQADLNSDTWPRVLGDAGAFETVVAADVLEHLYDPWKTLRQMAALIAADGNVVVSLPHAGHAAIGACLVNGDVEYRNSGLLDRTHIRFFGLRNVEELFAQAGLKIVEARYVIRKPEETELAESWRKLPEFVRAALRASKHANIYQVVVKAVLLDQPGAAVALT